MMNLMRLQYKGLLRRKISPGKALATPLYKDRLKIFDEKKKNPKQKRTVFQLRVLQFNIKLLNLDLPTTA